VIDDPRRVGFEAARLLDRLMAGRARPGVGKPVLVPPIGVATRRSTDVTAVEDRLVADAMRAIRQEACAGLKVTGLTRACHVSRSVLYRRFESALGRTPHEEILRVRLDRVKALLEQTELTLEEIAGLAGFDHPEYLSVAFKRETGVTPGEYRQEVNRLLR
jgi:LacI family transcriptional regulator